MSLDFKRAIGLNDVSIQINIIKPLPETQYICYWNKDNELDVFREYTYSEKGGYYFVTYGKITNCGYAVGKKKTISFSSYNQMLDFEKKITIIKKLYESYHWKIRTMIGYGLFNKKHNKPFIFLIVGWDRYLNSYVSFDDLKKNIESHFAKIGIKDVSTLFVGL